MEGGSFSKSATGMEGGTFSKLGSRLGAAHIRLKSFQQLQGWRAGRLPNWVFAKAPRTFVLKVSNGYRDGGRLLFKVRLSPSRLKRFRQLQGGWFSKLGSLLSAAHIRLKRFQQLQGWRPVPFQNAALAIAPRTFAHIRAHAKYLTKSTRARTCQTHTKHNSTASSST